MTERDVDLVPPPELGFMLGTLAVDPSVNCPVAQFGRLLLDELGGPQGPSGSPTTTPPPTDVLLQLSTRFVEEEDQLSTQIEQYRIAQDKLTSELQRIEAQVAAAEKKKAEAATFKSYCNLVLSGLAGLGDYTKLAAAQSGAWQSSTDQRGRAGGATGDNFFSSLDDSQAGEAHLPKPHPANVNHPSGQQLEPAAVTSQHPPTSRHGTVDSHHVTVLHADPNPSLSGMSQQSDERPDWSELQQLVGLLQLPDVKEQALTHCLSRCEGVAYNRMESEWHSTEEYQAVHQAANALIDHLSTPRPPLQILELRILTATVKRLLAQALPRGVKYADLHGLVPAVAKLIGSVNEEVKMEAVLFLVDILPNNDEEKAAFARSEGLQPLISIIMDSTNEKLLEHTIHLLWLICNSSTDIRLKVHDAGSLQPLLDLLYTDSIPILDHVSSAVASLTREDQVKHSMRECGGLEKSVASLLHPSERIVMKATAIVWNCAAVKENRPALLQLGCIPSLIGLLSVANEGVQENATGALWILSGDEACRHAIVQYMGIPALLKQLRHPKDAIVENASGTLWNCTGTEEVRSALRKPESLQELVNILRHSNPRIQEHAAGTLRNCAINDQSKLIIGQLGTIEIVFELLRSAPFETKEKFVALVWILTIAQDNRHRVKQCNGFPLLAELLHQYVNEPALIERVLGALRYCCLSAENRVPMLKAGVVSALASIAKPTERLLSYKPKLKEAIATIISQIARDEREAVRKEGGVIVCTDLLLDKEDVVIETASAALACLAGKAENCDALRDCGALKRLCSLLKSAAAATRTTSSTGGGKGLHYVALHSVLLALRNGTNNNTINQRLCAEEGAVAALLDVVQHYYRIASNKQRSGSGGQPAPGERTPNDVVRDGLLCIKNITCERLGCDELQNRNGIPIVSQLAESEFEDIRKAAKLILQSASRILRIQTIGGGTSSGSGNNGSAGPSLR